MMNNRRTNTTATSAGSSRTSSNSVAEPTLYNKTKSTSHLKSSISPSNSNFHNKESSPVSHHHYSAGRSSSPHQFQESPQQQRQLTMSPLNTNGDAKRISSASKDQLDPITLSYYETQLQSFNLLEPVLNPHGGGASNQYTSLWTALWNSELLGGEGELEEYDPSEIAAEDKNNPIFELEKYVADIRSSVMGEYASYWNNANKSDAVPSTNSESIPISTFPQSEMLDKLDLSDFHRFMGRTGQLSTKFEQRKQQLRNEQHIEKQQQLLEDLQENDESAVKQNNKTTQQFLLNKKNFPQLLACEDFIPHLFFSPDFDLTNSRTFEQLMAHLDDKFLSSSDEKYLFMARSSSQQQNKKDGNANEQKRLLQTSSHAPTTPEKKLDTPKKKRSEEEWKESRQERREKKAAIQTEQLSLLTQYLDSVEISLLEQVRSKSHAYFTETARFSELKTLVKDGCEQVLGLRSMLVELLLCNVEDVERIPKDAFERNALDQLSHLLDLVDNVVTAKSCVAGLISTSNDDDARGAIEAIRGARMLFNDFLEDGQQQLQQNVGLPRNNKYILGKLRALSNVNSQLGEYEKIVVDNLSNKLVDIFLTWNSNNANKHNEFHSVFGDYSSQFDSSWQSLSSSSFGENSEKQAIAKKIINSLALCNKLSETNILYTERLCDVIKTTVKTTVQECIADAVVLMKQQQQLAVGSIAINVTNMSFDQFMDCLDMLFEQILGEIKGALSVSRFLRQEGIILRDSATSDDSSSSATAKVIADVGGSSVLEEEASISAVSASVGSSTALNLASELAHKSVAELLRIKKDAHSLIGLEQMQRLWDACLSFTVELEKLSGTKAYGLRSTLLAQTKAFVERKHENNMTALVSALDSEKWTQCDVSAERQASLTRLCAGRAVLSTASLSSRRLCSKETADSTESKSNHDSSSTLGASKHETSPEAEVEGTNYKVVWSCLLLVEMVLSDVSCAAHFQTLATNMISKVVELLRLFNTRTSQLVLGAGAIHSSAKLKSINAKHLALVTQCLGMMIAILPHIRAALMAQLPSKQHLLLSDLDKVKQDYADHLEKVLTKFVTILGGIVEHGLAPLIVKTDFDQRSKTVRDEQGDDGSAVVSCSPFFDGVISNTSKMHQVLSSLLPPEHLRDVFSRIFLYLDQKIPLLYSSSTGSSSKVNSDGTKPSFKFPITDKGKDRMIIEIDYVTECLNALPGVTAWNFTVSSALRRQLGIMNPHETDASGPSREVSPQEVSVGPETTVSDTMIEVPEKIATSNESIPHTTLECSENGSRTPSSLDRVNLTECNGQDNQVVESN